MSTWEERQEKIKEVFKNYSAQDIVNSLFCSSLWLPNISSQIKHIYLAAFFISCQPELFKRNNQIDDYTKFSSLMSRLIPLLPSFPLEEDYFPEADWGEIKFFFDDRIYRIFYGNEITDIYDYLSMFEIMYAPINDKFVEKIGRSPSKELSICLNFQNEVLSSISQAAIPEDKLKSIQIGHYEVPEQEFWLSVNNFLQRNDIQIPQTIVKNYTVEIGSSRFPGRESFIEAVIYGRLAQSFFVLIEGKPYWLNPRRFSCILIEEWFQLYHDNKNVLFEKKDMEFFYASASLGRFIDQRVKGRNKFRCVSAVYENNHPHEILFSFATIYEHELLLFYLLSVDETLISQKISAVEEAIKLIRKKPHTLALHLKRQNVQFRSNDGQRDLGIRVIAIYPNVCIQGVVNTVDIPESFSGSFIGMTDFLGIFDETQSIDEFIDFLDHIQKDESPITPMASLMDRYAAYKDSHKIIVDGANRVDMIALDPHWGSSFKYKKLSEFWSLYPDRNYFDHPRSWRIKKESSTRVRLDARGYLGCALFTKVNNANFFFTAPFGEMTYEEAKLTDMLLMCLEDYFSSIGQRLMSLAIFQRYNEFNINIFPDTLVTRECDTFKHLNSFLTGLNVYNGEAGFIKHNIVGVRMVYSFEKALKQFSDCTNSLYESELFLYVAKLLDALNPDAEADKTFEEIKIEFGSKKPRYKVHQLSMGVCFNHLSGLSLSPEIYEFKKARKEVACLAKKLGVKSGVYELSEAKTLINEVRRGAVKIIDVTICEFDHSSLVILLMKNLERLMHHVKADLELIEKSVELDVDYDRSKKYAKIHSDYLSAHRNYRYLIEKVIQHSKAGKKKPLDADIKYLLAFADEIHVFYEASDLLHYSIAPVLLEVSDSYIFRIKDKGEIEGKTSSYGEVLASHQIYNDSNTEKSLWEKEELEAYLDKLDAAFKEEFGFTFRNMQDFCDILAAWPNFNKTAEASDLYSADEAAIIDICKQHLKNIKLSEISGLVQSLTLDQKHMLTILGKTVAKSKFLKADSNGRMILETLIKKGILVDYNAGNVFLRENEGQQISRPDEIQDRKFDEIWDDLHPHEADDLPVWEINKRPNRYIAKPLIRIGNNIFWGPYSVDKTQKNWLSRVMNGDMPFDLQKPKVVTVIEKRKQDIERKIVEHVFDFTRQTTSYIEKELYLHKRDKNSGYPDDLGDFDVIAFWSKHNVLLNIECKDLTGGYCPKDSKKLREALFGDKKGDGYIGRVEYRETYLRNNLVKIFKTLNWTNPSGHTKVVSLFVSRSHYYWYLFPPYQTDVRFVKVSMLKNALDELSGDKKIAEHNGAKICIKD